MRPVASRMGEAVVRAKVLYKKPVSAFCTHKTSSRRHTFFGGNFVQRGSKAGPPNKCEPKQVLPASSTVFQVTSDARKSNAFWASALLVALIIFSFACGPSPLPTGGVLAWTRQYEYFDPMKIF